MTTTNRWLIATAVAYLIAAACNLDAPSESQEAVDVAAEVSSVTGGK